ncbi:MAG TPA: YqgE/AlgH family protein [Myxococcota bacterium]|nr:YqgE/AlgH family protein [Myxococcota bacterium]
MKPSLLIASPQMRDPFFERAVVLVWLHDDDGALGVVVNRMLTQTVADMLQPPDGTDLSAYEASAVAWGGPVEQHVGTVLTRTAVDEDEGWNLEGGISVTRSLDALLRLIGQGDGFLLCLGVAGWGPGQLDDEIQQGAWLWTDCDASLVFEVPVEERYDRALATLGLTRDRVWMQPIDE